MRFERGTIEQPSAASAIAGAQVDILYGQLRWSLAANLLVGALLALGVWGSVAPERLLIWALLLVGVTTARGLLGLAYLRRRPEAADVAAWCNAHLVLIFASGAVWGLTAPMFFQGGGPLVQLVVAFALVGMGAGAVSSLASVRWAYPLFLVPEMLPVVWCSSCPNMQGSSPSAPWSWCSPW